MKTIKAIFIGVDGSLDYVNGKEYTLIIGTSENWNILINRTDGGGVCEYQSIVSFLKNWDNIKTR